MFEAVFNIVALVESNGQGLRLFKVFEQGAPLHDMEFSSLVANTYQQEVFQTLRAGDTLAITMHLDTPPRVISRTVRFREDKQFEGEGIQQPISDLLPTISTMYAQFSQQVVSGDVFRITLHVQRLKAK
ncbi:MAG TPA: hypothetical protein VNW73_10385 [Ktedonobacteraceae bacterium]|jgi:hypothetical protein|nr:hypothetical protein [Ktedonobacteraceae bacterium]